MKRFGWAALELLICLLAAAVGAAAGIGLALLVAANAKSDTTRVFVDPQYPNYELVEARLAERLTEGDGITLRLYPTYVEVDTTGQWPDIVTKERMFARVKNVASDPVDQALMMVREIHKWQDAHPKPVPPPPPAPPKPPEPPFDWAPVWRGGMIGAAALFVLLIVGRILKVRKEKRERAAGLAARADAAYRAAIGE